MIFRKNFCKNFVRVESQYQWHKLVCVRADDYPCPDLHFQCKDSHYCVPVERMCNGVPNCGRDDKSDEDPANCLYIPHFLIPIRHIFVLFLQA